ncbi:MAG: SCO family protein [Planctomycetes bacterium]|nr:SCO family protein [Planctomycetota bacterium]MCB9910577.1 SCO family protein [Planctomycetota bacterium]MCB9913208.1 SCO family protein [Planctomycetota bacterium]
MSKTLRMLPLLALLTWTLVALAPGARAMQVDPSVLPEELKGVNLEDRIGTQVPTDLAFKDIDDKPVTLGQFFQSDRPVLLTLNYASCPRLCGLQLRGLAVALGETDLEPGKDFDMLTISLDPNEESQQTRAVKQGFLDAFGRPVDGSAWNFLRGAEANIRAVADTVGFQYTKDEKTGEYRHPALTMVLSPEGKVLRYIEDLQPDQSTVRLSIVEAAQGKRGPSLGDRFLLFCYAYDPETGKYSLAAWRLMRSAGVLTIVFLATGFWVLQRARAREENP